MSDKALSIDENGFQTLLRTVQDTVGLQDTPAEEWPEKLNKRIAWLSLWDSTLAPLLLPVERTSEPFLLKPQRVNVLLHAWSLGQPTDGTLPVPNSAALLLQAHQGSANLLSSIAAWGQAAKANLNSSLRNQLSDEGQSIKTWLQRWERKEAELVMLQQIEALDSLTPMDQDRLTKLGGEAYKSQLMQVDSSNLRIALRDRVDGHSLERYFRDDPMAAETLLAIRVKAVSTASERLHVGTWNKKNFFEQLRIATAKSELLSQNYSLDVRRVTLINGDIEDASDACIFTHLTQELKLMLTISVQGGVAIMQLALLVTCDGLRVSDYHAKLIRISESVESPLEKLARGEIIEKVLQEALSAHKTQSDSSVTTQSLNLAG